MLRIESVNEKVIKFEKLKEYLIDEDFKFNEDWERFEISYKSGNNDIEMMILKCSYVNLFDEYIILLKVNNELENYICLDENEVIVLVDDISDRYN